MSHSWQLMLASGFLTLISLAVCVFAAKWLVPLAIFEGGHARQPLLQGQMEEHVDVVSMEGQTDGRTEGQTNVVPVDLQPTTEPSSDMTHGTQVVISIPVDSQPSEA